MNELKLAIVIPYYKNNYIEETLDSLAKQTNKNFTLYIGDDASENEINRLCESFEGKLNIKYKRFGTNLGGTNLVKQWNRCLEMVGDEEWIWLFSDDDVLDKNCVQSFYDEISNNQISFDVYHFDINVIGRDSKIIHSQNHFPDVLNVNNFLLKRSAGTIRSYVVEYIFKRTIIDRLGGFVNFPTAWHSDEATVIFGASETGIKNIRGGRVNWRSSDVNITPNSKSLQIVQQKIQASIEFSAWLRKFLDTNHIKLNIKMSYYMIKRFCYELHMYNECISVASQLRLLKEYIGNLRLGRWYPFSLLILLKFKVLNRG